MNINQEMNVADAVSENIKTAHIFKKYGIDFCCGGGVSITKACEKKNVNVEALMQELASIDNQVSPAQNYNDWELDFLADYIVNTHHKYVTEALILLGQYAKKVARVHGENHPPLLKVFHLYSLINDELTSHMGKEENILFPFIKKIVVAKKENTALESFPFGSVNNPISMMEAEHENAGNVMKEIAELTLNYTPPEWACNTFKALYAKLEEFETDLHLHIHLENNILFPKAIALEKELRTQA